MGVQERRAREKEERRAQITKAARIEFLENGLDGATMDSIAKRAEISKGAIYLHFEDKNALIADILDQSFARLDEKILEHKSSKSSDINCLKGMLNGYIDFCANEPEDFYFIHFEEHLLRSMGHFLNNTDDLCDDHPIIKHVISLTQQIEDCVQKGIASGQFRSDLDVKSTTLTITLLMASFVERISKSGKSIERIFGYKQEAVIESAFDLVIHALTK